MTESNDTSTVEAYLRYHKSAASRLRYALAQENMVELHKQDPVLKVLDAASGDGVNSEYFLAKGHSVTLMDSDPGMLQEARYRIEERKLSERCRLVEGRLEIIDEVIQNEQFDLILCHHVLEYTDSAPDILQMLRDLVSEEGELSLITLNPVSEVIRAAIFRKDPTLAEEKLTNLAYDAKWFGAAQLHPFERIVAWAEDAGWKLKDFTAIRVLADYFTEEELGDGKELALLRLEKKLGRLEPYRRLGRYLQFCFEAQ